jgi:hypothetical protein
MHAPPSKPRGHALQITANLLIKQIKRSGRGFRNINHYRLRILLAGGQPKRETHQVTRLRPRHPRSVA